MNTDRVSPQMDRFWQNLEEDDLNREKDNVVNFPVITGGKGPPTDNFNWLNGLVQGTVFLVEETNAGVTFPRHVVAQFILIKKFDKAALLLNNLNGEQYIMVNMMRFSNSFKLYELLYDPLTMPASPIIESVLEEQEQQSEATDAATTAAIAEFDQLQRAGDAPVTDGPGDQLDGTERSEGGPKQSRQLQKGRRRQDQDQPKD